MNFGLDWGVFELIHAFRHWHCLMSSINVGPGLTEFGIDRMAFGQSECICLNIQNIPLL